MGRVARQVTLRPGVYFYSVYKTVNRERLMRSKNCRKLTLDKVAMGGDRKAEGKVQAYSLAVLEDRYFMAAGLKGEVEYYSKWMQSSHTSLADALRRKHDRVGPVGRGRPITDVVEDEEASMLLMFALDYAAVDAGLVDKPKDYAYSSYNFYAHGRKSSWTDILTVPRWYKRLGRTRRERQQAYRRLARKAYRQGLLKELLAQMNRGRPLGSDLHRRATSRFRGAVRKHLRNEENRPGALYHVLQWGFTPTIGNAAAAAEAVSRSLFDLLSLLPESQGPP